MRHVVSIGFRQNHWGRMKQAFSELLARLTTCVPPQLLLLTIFTWGFAASGCTNEAEKSAGFAKEHAKALAEIAKEDVRQVRTGLPVGAEELGKLLPPGEIPPDVARVALGKARSKSQDLRIAKSTFFALLDPSGLVIRTDQQQDRLVGKNLFAAFPRLAAAGSEPAQVVETRGSMPEAAEVRGKPDGQWVVAMRVKSEGVMRAFYATGWSWSAYAYRLENAVRSAARGAATDQQKVPLLYAFVVVEGEVYGAPTSPEVNARAVRDQAVLDKLQAGTPFGRALEITGRGFGLGAMLAPELGAKVAVAVLRSET